MRALNENRPAFTLPQQDASGFVLLTDVVPDAIVEARYYSTYNFVGERIDGYEQPIVLLTKEAADSLAKVSNDLKKIGYRLKIFDGYRPQRAVNHFMRWSNDIDDQKMKHYFYPCLNKSQIRPQNYLSSKSGHSRGSTVDLTIFDMNQGKEADMGAPFDFFGEISHPSYRNGLTDEQYRNRMILRQVMMAHGFKPLYTEWWHFTLRKETYPDTYFDFPVNIKSLTHKH